MCMNICFPNQNEKEFLDVAKKISIPCLWFVYRNIKEIRKIKDEKIKIYFGVGNERVGSLEGGVDFFMHDLSKGIITKNEKIFYCVDAEYLDYLNQVKIKEISDTNKRVVVPLNLVLKTNSSAKLIEKTIFLIRLFKKYNVAFVVSNFANSPYELKSEKEISALCGFLGIKKKRPFFVP